MQTGRAPSRLFWAFCLLAALTGPAVAAPCGAGLSTSDFSFRGVDAYACAGPIAGNPASLADYNGALAGAAGVGGGWQVLVSPSSGSSMSADWNGFRFTFLPESVLGPSQASGNFWLTVMDLSPGVPPEYPISIDLMLAPRVGNQWASYVFEDQEFTLDETGWGAWRITFGNSNSPGGPAPGAAQMSFLLRDFVGSDCGSGCGLPTGTNTPTTPGGPGGPCENGCTGGAQSVPEPSTLASAVLALASLAALRRRRQTRVAVR